MNYIISGGYGFIGRNLALALDRGNHSFIILDKVVGCDLCSCDLRIPGCDIFIHLAAITNIRDSIGNPSQTISDNLQMTLNCLNYCREQQIPFIFASSMGAPQALSPYSASKLACESACTAYSESYGLETTILRFSSVYGPQSNNKQSVIAKFIKSCMEKKPLEIYGDGFQTRDFIYVEDVVNAIINCNGMRRVNVCTGKQKSILSIAQHISDLSEEYLNYRPEIHTLPAIKGEITDFDERPISIDITPKVTLGDGIERTFKWYLNNYKP